ncbi:MAG: hypothetical protein L3J28_11100 [Candidatus Polarisedimenticolaceae bacterium]|nr:hypothetical protein [Candidatus Polarisedimenticolaceae bacterium]
MNLAAGLEDSLIKSIDPGWNGKQRNNNIQDCTKLLQNNAAVNTPNSKPSASRNSNIRFSFNLRPTYYKQGFFNVSVDFEKHFGRDEQKITIQLGKPGRKLQGYINRSANTNNAPRIMGGSILKDWLQSNFLLDKPVYVEVLTPTSIILSEK